VRAETDKQKTVYLASLWCLVFSEN